MNDISTLPAGTLPPAGGRLCSRMAWAIAPVLTSIKPPSIKPTSITPNNAAPVKQRSLKGPVIGKSILLHTARQRAHLAPRRLPVQSADSDQARLAGARSQAGDTGAQQCRRDCEIN